MSISLRQEFHIPRSRQFLKAIDHFRSINLHLLQRYAGNRERYLKLTTTGLNHLQNSPVSRQVTLFSYTMDNLLILEIIVIVMVVTYIEEAISF